ncbi:hypothetical protein SAMN05216516_107142 [Izhakiella capsodis]|uniref:Uncharacterized protein n=1 Tax=Izhakiella capsodis TaxID=1367852 RepID=A0A1I4Z2A8_9GAMM|nr:hypothetical protein SAMN05216516_107142 [Izhakiella capsodis]
MMTLLVATVLSAFFARQAPVLREMPEGDRSL